MDERGKIRGEARRYDPYSRFGEIMLYDIDAFGFCPGFITSRWSLMSENDLKQDQKMREQLEQTKYEVWKRHNITELMVRYSQDHKASESFDQFCKKTYHTLKE